MSYQRCFAVAICVNTNKIPEFSAGIVVRGYKFAFEDEHFFDYKFFTTDNDVDFVNHLQKITPSVCPVILGLIISHECFIAGPILKRNNVIGLSTTCSHDGIGKFFPYLYSAHPPVSKQIEKIIGNLTAMTKIGEIFVVHQPTEMYSEAQFSQFAKKFTGHFVDVPVDMDSQYSYDIFQHSNSKSKTIIFFTYPLPSTKILVKMSEDNFLTNNTTLIGNASWAESFVILQSLKKILKKVREAYIVDILDWKKVKNTAFVKKFKLKYKRDPLNAEILNYDITHFTIQCYRQSLVNDTIQMEKFKYCLTHTQYHGISGDFSFNHNSSFAIRPLYLTSIRNRM